jgi:ATP-binding cassette, subfamily C, bacterial PrsD
LLVLVLYGSFAAIEALRARITGRFADIVEQLLMPRLIAALTGRPHSVRQDVFADTDALRSFLSGPGPAGFLDLPWLPIYLGLIFLMHPLLGQITVIGLLAMVALLVLNELRARRPAAELSEKRDRRVRLLNDTRSAGEAIRAMAMVEQMAARLDAACASLGLAAGRLGNRISFYSAMGRGMRLALQSAVLATGAWLVIGGEASAGIIISASILSARALAPAEQVLSQWRGFIAAREAARRLKPILAMPAAPSRIVHLPSPCRQLAAKDLSVSAPAGGPALVSSVNFQLAAGDGLGIIGPSGSGKSSLARALVAAWPVAAGELRLDGQEIAHYDEIVLGEAVGYMPQDISLLEGSIGENIGRFREAASDAILAAARLAAIDRLVASCAQGYDTPIGERGVLLSAGQRQRIALARALFGEPFLIVLDEPNSNLDLEGEAALSAAILGARARGAIVIVIAHRASTIAPLNKLLLIKDGRQAAFGLKDDVLRQMGGQAPTKETMHART